MPQSLVQNIHHTIFSTKERIRWIEDDWEKALFKQISWKMKKIGCTLLEAGAYYDHVHILSIIDRSLAIPEFVSKIKSYSSYWIHRNIPGKKNFAWQRGYSSFSVSRSNIPAVRKYIRNQRLHHGRQGFKDELRALLDRNHVKYDERYLWD